MAEIRDSLELMHFEVEWREQKRRGYGEAG